MSLGSLPMSDSSNRPHVPVADDDPAVGRPIAGALIAAGFDVSEAPDGRTAVHLSEGRVARLRQLGYRVAVDDLGAGYAGLTSFAQLAPDIGFDMTLVRGADKDPVKQKEIHSVTRLCGETGISGVAEGIETRGERTSVVDLGCGLLQGHSPSRPGVPSPKVAW